MTSADGVAAPVSIEIHAEWMRVAPTSNASLEAVQVARGPWLANATLADGVWEVGFLRPETTYRVHARVEGIWSSGNVTTSSLEAAWSAEGTALLQPGGLVNACTANFILVDARNETKFMFTPAHCLTSDTPRMADGTPLGLVVARGEEGADDGDWALVRLDPDVTNRTTPNVRATTGPTGLLGREIEADAVACIHGNGYGFGAASATAMRCGKVHGFGEGSRRYYVALGLPASPGDSGSPVVMQARGEAVGMTVAGIGVQTAALSLCWLMEEAAAQGYVLGLARGTRWTSPNAVAPPSVAAPPGGLTTETQCNLPWLEA